MIPGIFAGAMGQGGGGFTYAPALILDPTDLSTLFQDSAGTVPVAVDGDPVGRWNDKSGNGLHFIQATSGSRPIYRNSGGVQWVDFTLGQFMHSAAAGALSFPQVALFVGYRPVSGVENYATIVGVPHAATHTAPFARWDALVRTSGGFELGFTSNGNQFLDQNVDAAGVGNDVMLTLGYSGMWRSTHSAVWTNVGRVNGVLFSASSAGTLTQTYPNSTAARIGANASGAGGLFQGRIYGVLVSDAIVTSQAWIDEWEAWIDARLP